MYCLIYNCIWTVFYVLVICLLCAYYVLIMCLFHFHMAIRPLWPQSWLLNLSWVEKKTWVEKPNSQNTLPRRQWHNKRSSNPRLNRARTSRYASYVEKSGHIARKCFKKTEEAAAVNTSEDVGCVPEDEPIEEAQVTSFRNQNSKQFQNLRRTTSGQQLESTGRSNQPSQQPIVSTYSSQPDQSNFVPRYCSQAVPQQSLQCRAHARPLCPECICVNPAERHDCGAMLDTDYIVVWLYSAINCSSMQFSHQHG